MREKLLLAGELASCLCGIEVKLVSAADGSLQTMIRESLYRAIFPADIDHGITHSISRNLNRAAFICWAASWD